MIIQRFPGIRWSCDNCGAHLNVQPGFNDWKNTWKCKECGYRNRIAKDQIVEEPRETIIKEHIEHTISFLEGFLFIGILTLLICLIFFRVPFSSISGSLIPSGSLLSWFYAYQIWSLILWPVLFIITVIGEKYWRFYNGFYSSIGIGKIIKNTFIEDVFFSHRVFWAPFNIIFKKGYNYTPLLSLLMFILWIALIYFIFKGYTTLQPGLIDVVVNFFKNSFSFFKNLIKK